MTDKQPLLITELEPSLENIHRLLEERAKKLSEEDPGGTYTVTDLAHETLCRFHQWNYAQWDSCELAELIVELLSGGPGLPYDNMSESDLVREVFDTMVYDRGFDTIQDFLNELGHFIG